MNYVIQVNDTDFPRELIEKNWTHEFSGIEYENGCTVCDACIESEQNRIPKSRKKIVAGLFDVWQSSLSNGK